MEFTAGAPAAWHVTLQSGALIELWADGYTEDEGAYLFSLLVRATEAEQAELDVTARTPADPSRVAITVARIPLSEVRDLHTAALRAVSGRCACPTVLV
ncbi:hypothetical protein ABZW03_31325 [Kitasatospora sp. NPDC004799]|uniref:hypothetical protein n=1 Tax=Kitasatospora sp. NPDC004799 TaxID=3154460 RepID=UPI0033B56C09